MQTPPSPADPPSFPQQPYADRPPQRIVVSPSAAPPRRSSARVVRDIVQAFALIVAAMWGAYTFIYREIVIPARRPAALVVTPTLEAIGRRGDTVLARATFQIVNRSDTKVYAPAIWYAVRGLKLEPVATDDSTYLRQNRENAQLPYATTRFSQFTAVEVIGLGKVNSEVEYWFEPQQEQRVEQILYIPADRYDAAQLQVQYLIAKDVHEVKEIRWRTTDEGDLEPRLVFAAESPYAGAAAALSDTVPRYVRWLRANQGGVSYVTATMSLWRGAPAAAPAPQPAP
ncbi:hypothetical protein [Longimicrobium sp.]|uniref:hypothetical protein n=1 Tax=Longimicrobium sp. TaxID=2029185 RepID=UPI002BDCD5DA|nr:hypothetical protein [Longimicrobium sp.]HSU13449.1 hypothetical protein [Longimicrobium sp.]